MIDTQKREIREKYKTQIGMTSVDIEMNESPEMIKTKTELGWLEKKAIELSRRGIDFLKPKELARELGRSLTKAIRMDLQTFGIGYNPMTQGYDIDNYSLGRETVPTA